MRNERKTRTIGFMLQTLGDITAAARGASAFDRECLTMVHDVHEKAIQWMRDTRQLTRNDATGMVRVVIAKLIEARPDNAPATPLQESLMLQARAAENFLACDYGGAQARANDAYRIVKPF
ncbi:hypothetical protein KABACHOK_05250 [Brevundimonas phage vB_BpoS-Kabachok]|uniref:Uncharacterized protein n=2 Tax=Marchewkavirus TaxID=3425052 RepID=A0A9E7MQ92_9CAUD|nr:hypothetical protein KABACHOK_05250 [Brevundimonas phage vB_BpoS-Kabachok]UTC28615.1 hypothetical protein MARCHEWKA_01020 [Brevundimonas phage vB_BpoS-Marchewka]UTC29609.1 hypothetical protein BAMBUS_05510 [Brevundimonas phage vB_BpoS-Bambus]